jgi:hypothetical protein
MADLAALERAFAAALTTRSVDDADVSVFAGPAARVRRRLSYYRGNVQVNARKALGNAYPICVKLVGDEFFDGLAFEYAARKPSGSGDLNEYGAGFSTFLDGFAPIAQVPYLPDLARLEWRAHRAHYAADAPPLDIARLASMPADLFDALTVALHPACALMESRWPLARLWDVHQPGFDGEFNVDFDAGPDRVLVYRPLFRVEVVGLDAGSFAFLGAAQSGASVGAAFARAREADPNFTLDARLRQWVGDRVIVGLGVAG